MLLSHLDLQFVTSAEVMFVHMKVRAINADVVSHFGDLGTGIAVVPVGDFSHYVKPGDGLIVYTTQDGHVTCDFKWVCLVIATDTDSGSIVVDSRTIDVAFNPDRHALGKWRTNPYLGPDKRKVLKYGFLDLFAQAFEDSTLATARLEDCVRYVFKPDLSIPTLNPVDGHVYLFRRPDLHKIGKTTNLQRRQRELEKEQGVQLELLHSFRSKDYTRAEGILLAQYRSKLREGAEWFELDESDVEFICSINDFGLDT